MQGHTAEHALRNKRIKRNKGASHSESARGLLVAAVQSGACVVATARVVACRLKEWFADGASGADGFDEHICQGASLIGGTKAAVQIFELKSPRPIPHGN